MKIKVEVMVDKERAERIKEIGNNPYKQVSDVDAIFWDQQCLYLGTQVLVAICKDKIEIVEE